jgi:hypothetical protein
MGAHGGEISKNGPTVDLQYSKTYLISDFSLASNES